MKGKILYFCLGMSILISCQQTNRRNSHYEDTTMCDSTSYCDTVSESSIVLEPTMATDITDDFDPSTESSVDFEPATTTKRSINIYSSYSEEYDNDKTQKHSNYKETANCVDGVVVYEGSGDYYIIETRRGLTICETYSGWLSEGDKVKGELDTFGFKYILNKNRNSEIKIYIEDYMLSEEKALRWLGEHSHLKSRDQDYYDSDE